MLDEGCLNAQGVADKCLKIPYYKYHSEICGVSIDLKTSLLELVYIYIYIYVFNDNVNLSQEAAKHSLAKLALIQDIDAIKKFIELEADVNCVSRNVESCDVLPILTIAQLMQLH